MKTDHGWPRKSLQTHLDRRKNGGRAPEASASSSSSPVRAVQASIVQSDDENDSNHHTASSSRLVNGKSLKRKRLPTLRALAQHDNINSSLPNPGTISTNHESKLIPASVARQSGGFVVPNQRPPTPPSLQNPVDRVDTEMLDIIHNCLKSHPVNSADRANGAFVILQELVDGGLVRVNTVISNEQAKKIASVYAILAERLELQEKSGARTAFDAAFDQVSSPGVTASHSSSRSSKHRTNGTSQSGQRKKRKLPSTASFDATVASPPPMVETTFGPSADNMSSPNHSFRSDASEPKAPVKIKLNFQRLIFKGSVE